MNQEDASKTNQEVIAAFADEHGSCWSELVSVAASMYENAESKVERLDDSRLAVLEPALAEGWIQKEKGLWFADEGAFRKAVTEHLEEKLLQHWDDAAALARDLQHLSHVQHRLPATKSLGGRVLSRLHSEYGRDVLKRVREVAEAEESNNLWAFLKHFSEALPRLQFGLDECVQTLAAVQRAIGNHLGGGAISQGVKVLCEERPPLGEDLFEKLMDDADGEAVAFLSTVLRGIATYDFEGAHGRALQLTQSGHERLTEIGIFSLGVLDYGTGDRKKQLGKTLARLEELEFGATIGQAAALAQSYGNLFPIARKKVRSALERLSGSTEPAVHLRVMQALVTHDDEFQKKWYRRALMNMTAVHPEHGRILMKVDACLSRIVQVDPGFALDFIQGWALGGPGLARLRESIMDTFSSTTAFLFNDHRGQLEERVTQWLNADSEHLHSLAAKLISERPLRPVTWHLSKEVLDSLSPRDVKYVAYKVLAHVQEGHRLSTLIFSLLQRQPVSEELQDFVRDHFAEYIVLNYYGSATERLEKKAEKGSEVEKKVAKEILERVAAYYEAREALPRLKEFMPPTPRVQAFQAAQQKRMQIAFKAAQGSRPSIVDQLFQKVPVKGGSGFYVEMASGEAERTPYQTHSVSAEVPRDERADPVGLAYRRFMWRNVKREDL